MKFLSVCSGIEAASQAWIPMGWEPVAFSEIEPFPCSVLKYHHPTVPNLGDMTNYANWKLLSPIDLLAGGTPCQSFSVAGLRKGLDDPRGNLMLTFGGIAAKFRPRWIVWENVPGVLSSNAGKDFAAFLGLLSGRNVSPPPNGWGNSGILAGEANAYGLAWRTVDAQYFGVPQRRRRPFVVGYLGDWRRATAVLFERHCMSGHSAPSRETGQLFAPTISSRPTGGGGLGTDFDLDGGLVAGTLTTKATGRGTPILPIDLRNAQRGEKSLDAGCGIGKAGEPAFSVTENVQAVAFSCKDHGADAGEIAPTLRSMGHDKSHQNGGGQIAIAIQNATRGKDQNGMGIAQMEDPMFTLDQGSQHAIAFNFHKSGNKGSSLGISEEKTDCLRADVKAPFAIHTSGMAVRRLTPRECERLQGFPDDYTRIPSWNGWRKMDSTETPDQCRVEGLEVKQNLKTGQWRVKDVDGSRYRALGNSWAVPCAAWIGCRIQMVEALVKDL